jgi:hypothetical protein
MEIKKYDFLVDPNGIMSIPNFIQIWPAVLELNQADIQADMVSYICMYSFHAHHAKNA